MFKKLLLLFLSLFLVLLANKHSKAQIVYPDKATFDLDDTSFLIEFELYNYLYPEYTFGPDGGIRMYMEDDSIAVVFGEALFNVKVKGASINDFAYPEKVNFKISEEVGIGHYKGTRDPIPGNYDYKLWPHGNEYMGNDGNLYAVAYLEFLGWEVWDYNTIECPNTNVGTLADECWMSAAILVKSTDGGLTWDKAGENPAEYVVSTSPYKYREQDNTSRHGAFMSGDVFKVGEYYYLKIEFWGEDFKISSIARTNDISDASSWKYYDGDTFSIDNINPYAISVSDPSSYLPPPIENFHPLNFNANNDPVEGLSYSSYFNKYIYVETRAYSFAPEVKPGIYFRLSNDGFNWSGPSMILPFRGNFQKAVPPGASSPLWEVWYPTLHDKSNPGGQIGEEAYLIWVDPQAISESGYNQSLNPRRDVKILPINFNEHEISSFEITHTNLNIPEDSSPGDGYCDNGYGRCSLITAITESESRPPWIDSSIPLTITIGDSAPDTLTEDYLARINKRTIIDGTAHQDFTVNSLNIENGWNGTYGVHIKPGFVFESGEGHELKGIDVQGVDIGGGEDGSQTSSISITQSKINSLTLNNAHTSGVQVGGFAADSANIIGQLVFDGGNNIIRGNHIGHDGGNSMVPSDETVVEMNANNRLEGNVIASESNILMNFGSSDASGNTVKNNYFGSLPWSTTALGSSSAAIKIVEAQANHFEGNTIQHSNTSGGEAAVFVLDANENLFYSNTISNNTSHGIRISGSSAGNIIGTPSKGNIIHDNTGVGVNFLVNNEVGNPVKSNRIYNNGLGSIANYTHIIPLGVPTLLSAFVHPNNDSLTIRHGGIEDLDTAPYRIDVFSNTTEPTLPQGETVLASDVLVDSTQLQRGGVRIPYSGSAGGYLSMTLTDSRPVTSEFTNTVQLLNASESPIASYSTMNISKYHTTDWFSEEILSISNIGGSTLKLSLLENLEWISVEPNTVSLANGESTELTITFDSRTLSEDIAAHTAAIRIVSNEMNPSLAELPVEIIFDPSSSGSPELSLSTDTLVASYTKPTENTTGTASFTLYNQSADSINWMVFKNQPWITGLEPAGGKIKDSVEVTTTFRLRPQDPIGIRNATVTVAAYFDGSQEQTQIELPVRLVLTDDEQEELPTVSFNPTELTFTDSVQIGDSWEAIVEVDINNLGTPGVNFQFLQSFTSFVTSNPFNGEITQSGKVQLTFSFDNIQEAILMDTSVTYRFFYPDKPVVELSIPVNITIGLIEEVIEPLPKIEFAIAPDSLFMVQQITLGDTLRIDEALLIKNLGEVGLNWELNLPNTPTTAPKLAGVVNDSLVVPILLEIPDITESTTLSETLGLELWYERIRNGESQRIDSLVRIPLVIQVDVISVSNEWLGDTPSEIVLYQNYPNPFNPSTQIRFALPSSKHVQLSVYNVSGQMVVELINGQMPAGVHHINFDAQGLSSGTYIYQLKSSDGVLSKKLLLIK